MAFSVISFGERVAYLCYTIIFSQSMECNYQLILLPKYTIISWRAIKSKAGPCCPKTARQSWSIAVHYSAGRAGFTGNIRSCYSYLKSAINGSSSGTSFENILLNSSCRFPGAFPLNTFKSVFRDEFRRESFFEVIEGSGVTG